MKKIYCIIFAISFFICTEIFAQPFDPSKDDEISSFTGIEYGVPQTYKYGSHWLSTWIDSTKLEDTIFLQTVSDFIQSQSSEIRVFYIDTTQRKTAYNFFLKKNVPIIIIPFDYLSIGSFSIRLSDTMDAREYYQIFGDSGLFTIVEYHPVAIINDNVKDETNYRIPKFK